MRQRAFSLMELMIVIVIIGILAAGSLIIFGDKTETAKEKVCLHHYAQLKRMITQHWILCDLDGKISLKGQYWKNKEGPERQVACSNFGTIAGETVKHFTNFASSPYEDLHNNLDILSYIGDPPKDGQFAYYPESAGFKLRVRCRGKVTSYQWPKSQFP